MAAIWTLRLLIAATAALAAIPPVPAPLWFTQNVDHFNFRVSATFEQRVLVNTDSYQPGGPILFYCGNEGDITEFYANTGFVFDIAPTFNAVVVFAEHRYFGESCVVFYPALPN